MARLDRCGPFSDGGFHAGNRVGDGLVGGLRGVVLMRGSDGDKKGGLALLAWNELGGDGVSTLFA
jgi:hypothetical protein